MSRLIFDRTWALCTLVGEAAAEPFAGQVAVAETIRNRGEQHYFSDGTVASTVLWPQQFSCWSTMTRNRIRLAQLEDDSPEIVAVAKAWDVAMSGSQTVAGSLLYYAFKVIPAPSWVMSSDPIAELGGHRFYRPR